METKPSVELGIDDHHLLRLIKRLAMLDSTYEALDLDAWLEEIFRSRPDQTTQRMADLADSMSQVVSYLDSLAATRGRDKRR